MIKETSIGTGRTHVTLKISGWGEDMYLKLYGGPSHFGCVVMCEPGRKTQCIKAEGHKDHLVAIPLAEAACKKYNKRVVCLAGIHAPKATPEEIETIKQQCKELEKEL
jgi:hypothetical protein